MTLAPYPKTYWLNSNVSDAFKSCQDLNQSTLVVESNHTCTDLIRIVRMHSNHSARGHSNYVSTSICTNFPSQFKLFHKMMAGSRLWPSLQDGMYPPPVFSLPSCCIAAVASARRSASLSSSSSNSCNFRIISCMYLPGCIHNLQYVAALQIVAAVIIRRCGK